MQNHATVLHFLKKYQILGLLCLIVFSILLRLYPIVPDRFPYLYDHAKDTLVMYEMGEFGDPSLVGPTTSIPGLFYGPLWYYLAFPLNYFTDYSPLASVVMVVVLSALTVLMLWKFESKFAAFLYTVSVGMISLQQSAWTPYMTPFFTLPAILLISSGVKHHQLTKLQIVLLALCCGGLFHVQVAYAVVFTPLVLGYLFFFLRKQKHFLLKLGLFLFTIALTQIPSILFELKHDFIQTKSITQFIQDYRTQSKIVGDSRSGFDKIPEIFRYTYNSVFIAVTPKVFRLPLGIPFIIFLIWQLKKVEFSKERNLAIFFIVGTFLLYIFLPAKPYYFVAIYPIVLILFSRIIQQSFSLLKVPIFFMFTLVALYNMYDSVSVYDTLSEEKETVLAPKQKAVDTIYEMSEGKPFASYHFLPEVYDYVYQVIYLRKGLQGHELPTEFSYAPGEYTYIQQKRVAISQENPDFIFLIVENYKYSDVYLAWWDRVAKDLEIVETRDINQAIRIYKTKRLYVN